MITAYALGRTRWEKEFTSQDELESWMTLQHETWTSAPDRNLYIPKQGFEVYFEHEYVGTFWTDTLGYCVLVQLKELAN